MAPAPSPYTKGPPSSKLHGRTVAIVKIQMELSIQCYPVHFVIALTIPCADHEIGVKLVGGVVGASRTGNDGKLGFSEFRCGLSSRLSISNK